MKIEWTAPAEIDLEEIFDYIARDAPVYAEHYIDRIIDAVSILHEHPQLGRVVREAGQEYVRELIHQSHRIIYTVRADRIQILAIIHGRQDLENLPSKPWDSPATNHTQPGHRLPQPQSPKNDIGSTRQGVELRGQGVTHFISKNVYIRLREKLQTGQVRVVSGPPANTLPHPTAAHPLNPLVARRPARRS